MIIFKKVKDITNFLLQQKPHHSIGFVPTMGALHSGHISLIEHSKKPNDLTVCSIFVNPTQFNDKRDYEKYPVTIEKDIDMLEKANCDVLFFPTLQEIYPHGTNKMPSYSLGYLETILEGKFRPGHFQGVCQVVHRLLNIVPADTLYLGQKDYQQCMVIQKMIKLTDLKTKISICPTIREKDGLAMSSRNTRLNEKERKEATTLFEVLSSIKKEVKPGNLNHIKTNAIHTLAAKGFRVDYAEITHAETLELVEDWNGKTPLVALIAAFLNEVRLIDNLLLQD